MTVPKRFSHQEPGNRALTAASTVVATDAYIAWLGAHQGGNGGIVIVGTGSCGLAIVDGRRIEASISAVAVTAAGKTIKNVRVGYETYGKLNAAGDNAVFIAHFFSGTSHAAGRYKADEKAAGYWDAIIGPGKAIDTDKYFVVSADSGQWSPDDAALLRKVYADSGMSADDAEQYLEVLTEPGALTAALNWYRAGKPSGAADKVTVKTMYVWSTEDVAFGSAAAFETENWCTGGYRFEMVEDVSHWIPEEVPEDLNRLLLEHLAAQ